jgi:hypothetical protein
MNTQSPLEHSYILNNTNTACNENSVDTNKIKVLKVQRAGANLSNSMWKLEIKKSAWPSGWNAVLFEKRYITTSNWRV